MESDAGNQARYHVGHHGQYEYGQCQYGTDQEATGHIDQFDIFFFHRNRAWFQRHAAFRAVARRVLHDFRVHGAGVFGAFLRSLHGLGFQCHAATRAGAGACLAYFRTHGANVDEVIGPVREDRFFFGRLQVVPGIGGEFFTAAIAAKIVVGIVVDVVVFAVRSDCHAADRIFELC